MISIVTWSDILLWIAGILVVLYIGSFFVGYGYQDGKMSAVKRFISKTLNRKKENTKK